MEARYRASLVDDALVGTAAWRITQRIPPAGVLSVAPFNIAVRSACFLDTSLFPRRALLGDLDGKALGLLVEGRGEQIAFLEWSARGELSPARLYFDLRVPPAPLSSLVVILPADRSLQVDREDGLATGPLPGPTPDRR